MVNMAMRPWVRAAANGQLLLTKADSWGRVEVRVPDGVTRFGVFNQLPWRRGMLLGGCLMAATFVGVAWFARFLTSTRLAVEYRNTHLALGVPDHAVPPFTPAI